MITKETYRSFCIKNNYFSLGSAEQYLKALDIVDKINENRDGVKKIIAFNELATVTWICSETDNGIAVIYKELRSLYCNI